MFIRKAKTITVDTYGRPVAANADGQPLVIPDAYEMLAKGLREDIIKRRHLLSEYQMSWDQEEAMRDCIKQAHVALKLLAHGFEPTTPPDYWFLGAYKGNESDLQSWKRRDMIRGARVGTFIAPIPKWAVAKYNEATALGVSKHQVGIYSPNESDFRVATVHADPLMVCRLVADRTHYFEIARWDTAADLAALFPKE